MAPNGRPFLSILVVPSVVDGALVRAVELPDGSGRTEIWTGAAWEPSKFDLASVAEAPPASPETLARFGAPTAP